MASPPIRALSLLIAFLCACGLHFVRDVPAQAAKLKRESKALSGHDNPTRRIEYFRPERGDPPGRARTYGSMRQFMAFIDRILEETPEDARVGLVGVPWDPLGKYSHYFLFPRHPFVVDARQSKRASAKLKLDYLAYFDGSGRVERVR